MGELSAKSSGGLVCTHYVPYFVEMPKRGFALAFAYAVHSA